MAKNGVRGCIGISSSCRPAVPLDIYSCPRDSPSEKDEFHMTDGVSYNYNGQVIPAEALKTILKRLKLASEVKENDIDSGIVFVSERGGLETLHLALRLKNSSQVKVFSFDEVFDTLKGVRMEDSGSVASNYLIYISTKEPANERRQPWTAVYKTNLKTGMTERLTPKGVADLNPSVSPSGNKIAVASFQRKGGWDGEIEDLQTDIFVMNVEKPLERKLVVKNGGWPTWGSDDVIFFHRQVLKKHPNKPDEGIWCVFRADIHGETSRVTPDEFHAITPAAINATSVAVATIRALEHKQEQYRHIEIFDSTTGPQKSIQITQKIKLLADHFNPFVIDGGKCIGYHRCNNLRKSGDHIPTQLLGKLKSPLRDVELFRLPGVLPTFSKDGSKLAFVDNELKTLWLAHGKELRKVYEAESQDRIFSPVWNQDPKKDTLYVCMGHSFNSTESVEIYALNISKQKVQKRKMLTKGSYNNAFPSTNPKGGDWIVFSSTRDKPIDAPLSGNNLDPGYFAVFLVKANNPSVVIRVMACGSDLAGHVNHPFFSPDGKSIVVTADLAGVSVDPISLPLFGHSVRPYGDIFTFDIDPKNIENNKDVKEFTRITHSRYENSTSTWTVFSTQHQNYAAWNQQVYTPASCPYNLYGSESLT